MSGATISGTVDQDLSGDGTLAKVAHLTDVTVDLYKSGSSAVFEHVLTNSSGNYSFTNLSPGRYSVQQVVPAHFLPTSALDGYSLTLASGQSSTSMNFEDFELTPLPTISNLSFTVTTPAGKSTKVTSLDGNVQQGDIVKASFNLKTADQITLVAYTAPNDVFDTSNLQKQAIFGVASTNGGTGSESLTVKVPDGYFQLDFVGGPAIDHLATNPNVYYHSQDRFIDGTDGGTQGDPAVFVAPVVPVFTPDVSSATPIDAIARKH